MSTTSTAAKRRYGMLRTYRVILLTVGWVILILGVLAFLAVLASVFFNLDLETPFSGLGAGLLAASSLASLAVVGLIALGFLATADLILLLMDIEQNTRTAMRPLSTLRT